MISVQTIIFDSLTPLSDEYSESGRVTRGLCRGNFRPCPSNGKTEWGRRRFASHSVNVWNDLPSELKETNKLPVFKSQIKNLVKGGYCFYKLDLDSVVPDRLSSV